MLVVNSATKVVALFSIKKVIHTGTFRKVLSKCVEDYMPVFSVCLLIL